MEFLGHSGSPGRNQKAKELVAGLAARQFGRVSWRQLRQLKLAPSTIHNWTRTGYLYRTLPGIYAVGHRAATTETKLMEAVLYAGPGAVLSHATAAWWLGLTKTKPYMIDVSTPRRCKSQRGIRVHQRRTAIGVTLNGLPVTPLPQTMLDYAARASLPKVRLALAQADYAEGLQFASLEQELRSGRPGSKRLRQALERHQPSLARTRSGLEVVFFELCEMGGFPVPEINARVYGWEVDALWREQRVVVEVDGPTNHRTPAQVRRDRRKDLALRTAHIVVLRYSDEQLESEKPVVAAEIKLALSPP